MIGVKKFYYLTYKESKFSLPLSIFNNGPLPILWHNQGLYNLIPVEIVADAIRCLEIKGVSKPPYPVETARMTFTWDQTIEVPPEIGKQLFNEQFDNQTDSNES